MQNQKSRNTPAKLAVIAAFSAIISLTISLSVSILAEATP